MARMRTFLLYALGIIGFMFLSIVLEDGLIDGMYKKMEGTQLSYISGISIDDVSGRASSVNGNIKFKLTNDTDNDHFYVKVNLYSDQGTLAATKYIEVNDLPKGSSKNYDLKVKGNNIRNYDFEILTQAPDTSNIVNLFGWEFDLSNVFGLDLSNTKIFGVKISELFTIENAKNAGSNAWNFGVALTKTVPWWAYAIGAGIVTWYMPAGFILGIFPF